MARKTKHKSQGKHRASWKGNLSFGLVSFPVQAFNARNPEQGDIHGPDGYRTAAINV